VREGVDESVGGVCARACARLCESVCVRDYGRSFVSEKYRWFMYKYQSEQYKVSLLDPPTGVIVLRSVVGRIYYVSTFQCVLKPTALCQELIRQIPGSISSGLKGLKFLCGWKPKLLHTRD
jgi:hypothetical protein